MNTPDFQFDRDPARRFRRPAFTALGQLVLMQVFVLALLGLLFLGLQAIPAQSSLSEKVNSTTESAKETVEAGAQAASETAQSLWQRIEESRLKNRTPDEIVAWVLMGLLVGSLSGWIGSFRRERHSPLVHVLLGLAGSFLGGMVVRMTHLDFGWGPVLIRYEELLAALLGAALIVLIIRFWMAKWKKRKSTK